MSTPIYHATLLDYPELWGASALFAKPLQPTYTATNWIPATPWEPIYADWFKEEWDAIKSKSVFWMPTDPRYYGKVTGEFPKPESKIKRFFRCLLWWLP